MFNLCVHFLFLCLILGAASIPGLAVVKVIQLDMDQQWGIVHANIDFRKLITKLVLRNWQICTRVSNSGSTLLH